VTATGNVTLDEAEKILMANKVEKLLLVDARGHLTGLITIKDIDMMKRFPNACKDRQGRLRVGAAVGVFDFERAESLIAKGVDVLIVDSAHGHSDNVIETVAAIKKRWESRWLRETWQPGKAVAISSRLARMESKSG
jgi:IMP dehydrogenase